MANPNDLSAVIQPKSDQLNADDMIAGPRTITIRDIKVNAGSEQPVSIYFEGDNGKPWKPCKSMSRLMVSAWGADASKYKGRSLTLYRDPTVKWGGMEVGGIRVSHMSDIAADHRVALTATKGKRVSTVVKPLRVEKSAPKPAPQPEPTPTKTDEFDFAEWEGIVNIAVSQYDNPADLKEWWDKQIETRKDARDADADRAGKIATRVNNALKGE